MLPKVFLADLRAEELANEMVRRIAAHTPEWRNARPGDPGRALIDVFAWMGEQILYRADLTPRRMRLEFLNLLNLKQRPAQPARGLLQLSCKVPAQARPVFVAPGTKASGAVPFEVLTPATVQPLEGQVYIKRRLQEDEREALAEVLASLSEVYQVADLDPYQPERLFGPGDLAKPDGLDPFADSIDQTLWIALLALDATPQAMAAARAALDEDAPVLNIGVIPRLTLPEGVEVSATPAAGMRWTVSARGSDGAVIYLDLPVEDDRTAGLGAEGTLRVVLPGAAVLYAPSNDLTAEVDAGVGNRPPRIDDPVLAARLLGWVRLSADDPAARLPLAWVGINAVMVDQRESHGNLLLGTGSGQSGQRLRLPARDVDVDSIVISVAHPGQPYVVWGRVDELGAAARDDMVYELDAEAGEVLFGDDLTGQALRAGSRVRLEFLRAGGGETGNLAAGSLGKIDLPGLVAFQPAAFSGGVAAETLDAAEKRVGAMLTHRNRCVTEDDYRAIGAELGLARIEVLPGFRPAQRRMASAGAVSVMVFPDKALRRPANPRADRRLLDRVQAHLDPRRPIGTELSVISPEYVGLGLTAAIGLRDGFAREDVLKAVKERLYAYLWPLPGGGPDGVGWPLGRAIRNLEIEVEIARIAGVATTQGVNIFAAQEGRFGLLATASASGAQVLTLESWQLPELLTLDVVVDQATAPASLSSFGAPVQGHAAGGAVGVPVIPEVC